MKKTFHIKTIFQLNLFVSAVSFMDISSAQAEDFPALYRAVPHGYVINGTQPVFDFDADGCLPGTGISRSGKKNGGLQTSGKITGNCRASNFLDTSNTFHRYACAYSNGSTYCGHFYALYFEKDQVANYVGGGHRHDWEVAAVWTRDGRVTHGSYSAHGDLFTRSASELEFEGTHLKIVYHKEGPLTHAFRFAKRDERAENPYGRFVTPTIVSWYEMYGDGLSNIQMRNLLNNFDYGSASIPFKDSKIYRALNDNRPNGFPSFSFGDIESSSRHGPEVEFYEHCHYNGYRIHLNEGSYNLSQLQSLGIRNDDISSLYVPSGVRLVVYEHGNFNGQSITISDPAGIDCLVQNRFNDNISSLRIMRNYGVAP